MVIRLPERLSMRSATIFSGSGTGLFHRTAQLFPAERKNWLFSGSSPIYQNTWEMFLNRSVCNIFGNCFWQADHLCFFQSWVVGGEQIPAKKNRRKLTLWVFRIKQRPCSVNVKVDQGVLKTLVSRSQLFSYTEVHLFLFAKTGFTQGCREMAETLDHVSLISFTEMMELFREPQV